MKRALVDILCEERRLGNKENGGWQTAAYNSALSILSSQFDIHVKSCGFRWDPTKKMISVDEDYIWKDSHMLVLKAFVGRSFQIGMDIVDLCGKDRATGEGVETGVKAIEIMTPPHNEPDHIDLVDDMQI
ncbi:hypothetical protein D8674_003940 [Pyrus ussuriensis x Pyrus communis]|uniref:Myb/SANT-like domain-containing protein n=1 Tax=Pyrus ussuriensis x Pyrus communis TaxID=2448454 RepID=A0A5N5FIG7_9ROSA|nr:hypothetical protein D8674_003940 [Pyrus ussuriensis x Pyrus communis]